MMPWERFMRRLLPLAVALLIGCCVRTAQAEHFQIELTVETPREKVTSHSDTSPPPEGLNPRPVCHAKHGQPLVLQFFFTSNFPHGTKKSVGVHYFVRPQKDGATTQPAEPAGPEGTFTMDFKPDGRVGLRQQFHIDKPGTYLVRVESQQSDSDHEHFSALDLVIE